MLSPAKREALARKITTIATDQYILEVRAEVIDELRLVMTMNDIMVRSFSQVVGRLHADRAILDAADVNAERFAQAVRNHSKTSMDLIAEHKADQRHHVVSAASILAKVRRDRSHAGWRTRCTARSGVDILMIAILSPFSRSGFERIKTSRPAPGIAGQRRNASKLVLYRPPEIKMPKKGSNGYRGYFAHDSRAGQGRTSSVARHVQAHDQP